LHDWDRASLVPDAAIAVTELATNAVIHARTSFSVIVSLREGTLRIGVRDACLDVPIPRFAKPEEPTGRGLRVLQAVTTAWGV
ncbi:ATP-binding protein, partial [Escherichia coli]